MKSLRSLLIGAGIATGIFLGTIFAPVNVYSQTKSDSTKQKTEKQTKKVKRYMTYGNAGFALGWNLNSDLSKEFSAMPGVQIELGESFFEDRLRVGLEFEGYWGKTSDRKQKNISLHPGITYRLKNENGNTLFYVGGSIGINDITISDADGKVEVTSFGEAIRLGTEFNLTKRKTLKLYLETQLNSSSTNYDGDNINIGTVNAKVGLRF